MSSGIYNLDKKLIYPDKTTGVSFMLEILFDFVKKRNENIWNISGNDRKISAQISWNDGIAFSKARSIIADHDFLKKHFENREKEVVECDHEKLCHYFSLQKKIIERGFNKQLY